MVWLGETKIIEGAKKSRLSMEMHCYGNPVLYGCTLVLFVAYSFGVYVAELM